MSAFRWDQVPRIDTSRLLLRPIAPSDVQGLFAVYGDDRVMQFASEPAFPDSSYIPIMLASVQRLFARQESLEWAVCLLTDQLIGTSGLHSFAADRRQAEVGCLLAQSCWGQGLMREALTQVLTFGFAQLDLTTIVADIDEGNQRSRALFARLGFMPLASSHTLFTLSREQWLEHLEPA